MDRITSYKLAYENATYHRISKPHLNSFIPSGKKF